LERENGPSGKGSPFPLVELKKVRKSYRFGDTLVDALKGVDLVVEPGEFVAIWGPSGSGKSTLCNLVGLLDRPTSGVVLVRDENVDQWPDEKRSELRNTVFGFIFQTFNLIPVLSALENVMLPLQIQGTSTSQARKEAIRQLSRLGLGDHLYRRPDKLSGGQQQRVAIARALINNPGLVVADEPTANLDSETALMIIDLMRQLNEESGQTFFFSTHDHRLLDRVRRQILLRDGTILEDKKIPSA
jgi:putative ABC transport system ATP-binding protein